MQPAGLLAVEIPADLDQAFDAQGRLFFDAFPPSVRRGILQWIEQAKGVDTRRRRVEETATKARTNECANHWTKKKP